MAVKKGLGKGLDSLITDKVNTKPAASKNNPTPKSEHAADAIMMNITKVEPNREQPRKKSGKHRTTDQQRTHQGRKEKPTAIKPGHIAACINRYENKESQTKPR